VRRSVAVMFLVVGTIVALGAAFAYLRFAPESRSEARLAQHDALWAHTPDGMEESFRHVGLIDARWLPVRNGDKTVVQRAYRYRGAIDSALEGWDRAARASQWTFASSMCNTFSKRVLIYTKPLGRWTATLHVQQELSDGDLGVLMFLPDDAHPTAIDGAGPYPECQVCDTMACLDTTTTLAPE
jgi:hypothetical protein